MDKKKSLKRPTAPKPFNFNEKKRDPKSRSYLDEEPAQETQDQFKKMMQEKARKAAQQTSINPNTTKKSLAAAQRRREEIESKRADDDRKTKDDKMRSTM